MAKFTPDDAVAAIKRGTKADIAEANRPASKAVGVETITQERLPAVARDPDEAGRWGFKNFQHYCQEIKASGKNLSSLESARSGATDTIRKCLTNDTILKAATDMGELVGSDGGFLVPPQFSDKIFERMYKENNLLTRCDNYTTGSNTFIYPRNAESSRANGSRWGGVQGYWTQEGSQITHSKPTFGRGQLSLNKLATFAAVTDEMLADTGTLASQYLTRVFASEIAFKTNDALIRGTGAGMPLGILNAACTVSVAIESGQLTQTIVSNNITKMWARLFRGMGNGAAPGAVWFINQDVLPQLQVLSIGVGTAGMIVYTPPGGLSGSPYATLLGAPVVEIEQCSTLGTVGDIILADLSHMVAISKGMETQSSLHFYFDTDQTAFRVTFRVGAGPWWASALTPFQGTNTQSCFVTLATR